MVPMPQYRALVSLKNVSGLAEDDIVNTLYFRDNGPTTDPQNLADDLAALYATYRGHPSTIVGVEVRFYDMAHAKPREVQAFASDAMVSSLAGGPREVALCLSYYSGRNLKRRRGRVYIGPWSTVELTERPGISTRGGLSSLATGLANLGGIDVDWMVHSVVDNAYLPISHSWVDNEWDTIRSRGLKANLRDTATHDEDPE